MEVGGGVGYVEEWPDAQLLRDAHRGSIRERIGNIVLLDVLRPARREDSLEALARRMLHHRVMPPDPLDPADRDADGLGPLLYEPAT